MSFKVIETFSGIGAQAKALQNLSKSDPNFDYNIVATVEWEMSAMYAYDIIHHGPQDLSIYDNKSKRDLLIELGKYNLSSDGKVPLNKSSLSRMSLPQLKAILHSIKRNNNLVDISKVTADELPDADLLTYSFPCQDLSISSFWHNNFSGIQKGIGNRSGLLWEIERILNELKILSRTMPRFLLMENVTTIHGPRHIENFNIWIEELESLGYYSHYFDLDSSDFGIPQSRIRTFMISVYIKDLTEKQKSKIIESLSNNSLYRTTKKPLIDSFLRLDYTNIIYKKEALESTPNNTPSREKINAKSSILAIGNTPNDNIAKTITTKQDRYPNAGIILHGIPLESNKSKYRNLTPRETFLLMGFDEHDFQNLVDNNLYVTQSRQILNTTKLLKLSGNSIVVNILESIFTELIYINNSIINDKRVHPIKSKPIKL